jgi:hypothetical protein
MEAIIFKYLMEHRETELSKLDRWGDCLYVSSREVNKFIDYPIDYFHILSYSNFLKFRNNYLLQN